MSPPAACARIENLLFVSVDGYFFDEIIVGVLDVWDVFSAKGKDGAVGHLHFIPEQLSNVLKVCKIRLMRPHHGRSRDLLLQILDAVIARELLILGTDDDIIALCLYKDDLIEFDATTSVGGFIYNVDVFPVLADRSPKAALHAGGNDRLLQKRERLEVDRVPLKLLMAGHKNDAPD